VRGRLSEAACRSPESCRRMFDIPRVSKNGLGEPTSSRPLSPRLGLRASPLLSCAKQSHTQRCIPQPPLIPQKLPLLRATRRRQFRHLWYRKKEIAQLDAPLRVDLDLKTCQRAVDPRLRVDVFGEGCRRHHARPGQGVSIAFVYRVAQLLQW
jgi:hypothetical protein